MKKTKISIIFLAGLLSLAACQFGASSNSVPSSNGDNSSVLNNSSQDASSNVASSISSVESSSNAVSSESKASSSSYSSSSSSAESKSSSYSYSSIATTPDSKWNIDTSLRGNAFRDNLEKLITSKRTKTASYDANKTIGPAAAAYKDTGKFVPFYHDVDTLTTYASCNREHTWPNSRGAGKSGPGSDPFIIRPTLTSDNSSRGNNFYGLSGSNEWDPASCGFTGARGEAARVILYAATAYHTSHKFELSNNPSDATSANTMGTLKYLIQWNKEYPVTDMEKQINNYLDTNGYGRNPFVDHPEYADFIWNEKGLLDISSIGPGGETTDAFENGYDIYKDLQNLSGKELMVVSASSSSGPFYSMEAEQTTDSTPWYLKGTYVNTKDDMSKMVPMDSSATLAKWTFNKTSDGTYTLYNKVNKKYLSTEVSGTHYNVALTDSIKDDKSSNWTITASGEGFKFVSGINIYLEYYRSSFCGYNNAPSVPIYLYA